MQKRLESSHKFRKSSRLTIFDSIRNLSRCASPAPLSEAQQKMEHRKQQLEKWKEEKQKKKKEAASQKKKPFIAGVPHVSMKFLPPPPAPLKPSTSGRVTRSQSARNSKPVQEKQIMSQSFAPKNASFKPPQLKNIPRVPYVSLVALKQVKNKTTVTFDPVLPTSTQVSDIKQTQSRIQNKPVEYKASRTKANDVKPKGKTTKPVLKTNTKTSQSSSSSENGSITSRSLRSRKSMPPLQSPALQSSTDTDSSSQSPIIATKKLLSPPHPKSRRSHPVSPILTTKTPRKSTPKKPALDIKQFTPKNKVPKSESSSEERLRSPKSPLDMPMTPEQIVEEAKKISPCVTLSRGKDNARREMKKKLDEGMMTFLYS